MRFHGRLTDPSLAPYFEVFKRRVIGLYNTGIRYYDHWTGGDTFMVQMRITGDDVYVLILGLGTGYFEFQTTGMPVDTEILSFGGIDTPIYHVNVVGVNLIAGNTLQATATISGGRKDLNAYNLSPIGRPAQAQLYDEPVMYPGPQQPRKVYPNVLYQCYSPSHSHTGIYMRAYQCAYLPYHFQGTTPSPWAHETRDVGFDMPWAQSYDRGPWQGAYLSLDNGADWPRRSGQSKVVDSTWGERDFTIYVDAFDQVNVFPTASITQLMGTGIQNVPVAHVHTQRVSFPTWTFAKTQRFSDYFAAPDAGDSLGTGNLKFPEIDWKIHPDGTSMCAVVHEQVEAQLDTTFFGTYATDTGTIGPGVYYPTATSFFNINSRGMGIEAMARSSTAATLGDKWYHVAPGLLEIDISVQLTGRNPEDFTVTLTTHERRRPTTSTQCGVVAGYVWHDVYGPKNDLGVIPKDAARGDLCVLDIECYGEPMNGYNGQLYSLKNITTGKEIRTFCAQTQHTSAVVDESYPVTGNCLLVAYNMQTLSFVTKDQLLVYETVGTDALLDPVLKVTMHFGLSVRVMGAYQTTLFPLLTDPAWMAVIKANAKATDARARLFAQFGVMPLMPLNDLRTWGDADLDSLREWYCRAFTHQTYVAGYDPFQNWAQMETFGNKYYKLGARDHPFPSTTLLNWYNSCMAQDQFRPFPMFDVTEPRPGWYLYAYQVMAKLCATGNTTFFTHPNGTWALYDQQFIYNANGVRQSFVNADSSLGGSLITDLDITKLEHCIFDFIHFSLPNAFGTNSTLNTSFLEQYNNAVIADTKAETITDDTTVFAKDYSDIKIKFSVLPLNDPFDYRVSYANLILDWYKGYQCTMRDTGYFVGEKVWGNGFDSTADGQLLATTLGTRFINPTTGFGIIPLTDNGQNITFSSCVLLTP